MLKNAKKNVVNKAYFLETGIKDAIIGSRFGARSGKSLNKRHPMKTIEIFTFFNMGVYYKKTKIKKQPHLKTG
jgi:hypothetical protein